MFIMTKNGAIINRAQKEFYVDSVAALNEIPQQDYNFGSIAVVVTDSAVEVYIANASKVWVKV